MPLIIEVRPDERVEDYLSRVAAIVEDSYAEPHFPLETLVRNEDMALAQLTKVALADDRVHHAPTGRDDDLQLHLRLAREIELRYSAAIEPFIIDGFAGSLGAVLAAFEHLDTPVGDIASARRKMARCWPPSTKPRRPAPATRRSSPCSAQVARTPTAPALVTDSALMTYADLNARANSLAHQCASTTASGRNRWSASCSTVPNG